MCSVFSLARMRLTVVNFFNLGYGLLYFTWFPFVNTLSWKIVLRFVEYARSDLCPLYLRNGFDGHEPCMTAQTKRLVLHLLSCLWQYDFGVDFNVVGGEIITTNSALSSMTSGPCPHMGKASLTSQISLASGSHLGSYIVCTYGNQQRVWAIVNDNL